ncbi:MAG: hypothetical protein QOJ09_1173 [Actinomycetota bacterium]|nr:hypothetical protein [Actinomycetota bacterium]
MATFVVRVWMPDRPGVLGAVASRVGAVRGDVVGIDILERGAGRAIDELVVELPDEDLVPLLIAEIGQVDGVDVEDVRPALSLPDPRLAALEAAALLVEETTPDGLLATIVEHARADFEGDWAAVICTDTAATMASAGETPTAAWLTAFVDGSRSSDVLAAGEGGPDDLAWSSLPAGGLALIVGRHGRPFRARERRQLAALARIADRRWAEVSPAVRA